MVLLCVRTRRLFLQLTLKHKQASALCIVSSALLLSIALWTWYCMPSEYEFEVSLGYQEFVAIQASLPKQSAADSTNCSPPNLPLLNDLIRNNRPARIPSDLCSKSGHPNWLQVSRSRIQFKPEFASASCSAEPIVRVDDHTSSFAAAQPIQHGSELPSLGFRATCTAQDGRTHSSVYYGIKRRISADSPRVAGAQPASPQRDNIMIVGLDSLSRLESLRSLPTVSRLVKEKLGGVTLQQYNILGDGTPAALLPILTGVREEEMPDGRKGFKTARHVDETMRWIFQDVRELGYVTLWGEEQGNIGTFQMRFLGFNNEPVDFYLRPALLKQEPLQTDDICIGDEVSSVRMLQTIKDLYYLHPNQSKFSFVFLSSLSHENKDLSLLDSELSKFFEWFVREDLMRNTTLILMSDHGQRYGPMRNSMQGKLEESLPLMTLALSRQLSSERKSAVKTLLSNVNRISTPVDIHRTLLSVAGVRRSRGEHDSITSYSLIEQSVPESRSCSDAGIPTHWCSCLRLTKLSSRDSQQLSLRAARFVVREMNAMTHSFRHLCHELQLQRVIETYVSLTTLELAMHHRQVSKNNFNVENATLIGAGFLSLRFVTAPNAALYDATVQFSLFGDRHALVQKLIGEASRINRYGSQSGCVAKTAPRLRKFCFCRRGGLSIST